MSKSKKILNYVGKLLMVLAFAFIIYRLYQYDVDLRQLADKRVILQLLLLILCHGANVFVLAPYSFSLLVSLYAKKKVSRWNVTEIYCKSNLYKYLPGNIMHFVGRNQIALVEKISHADVILATVTEMAALVLAAVLITLCSSSGPMMAYLNANKESMEFLAYLPVVLVCLLGAGAVLGFLLRKKMLAVFRRYQAVFTKAGFLTMLRVMVISSLRLLVNAGVFLGCLSVFTQGLPVSQWGQALGLFVMSWVIGFITPGAPGGLGVREAIMCFFFAGILGESVILYAALIYRVICVLGDMTSYVYVLLAKMLFRNRLPSVS